MITIITGRVDSGKTRYLKRLYEETKRGDGFLSVKRMDHDKVEGYDLQGLQSGELCPFIRHAEDLPPKWKEAFRYGRYSFSESGFSFAEKIIRNITEGPVYLDEAGPLEIELRKGFYPLMTALINSNRDLFMTVRSSLLNKLSEECLKNKEIRIITI